MIISLFSLSASMCMYIYCNGYVCLNPKVLITIVQEALISVDHIRMLTERLFYFEYEVRCNPHVSSCRMELKCYQNS